MALGTKGRLTGRLDQSDNGSPRSERVGLPVCKEVALERQGRASE